MIAGTTKMTVVCCSLLFAMGRADTAVRFRNDHLWWAAVMYMIDPRPVQVCQGSNVVAGGQELCLEAAHLTCRSRPLGDGMTADNPSHGRVVPEAVGVVHVLVAAEPSKRGLTKQTGHPVLTVLPSPRVYKPLPGNLCQTKGIVKLSIGEQPSIGRDLGTVEFQLQAAVKTDPQRGLFAFTRRVK